MITNVKIIAEKTKCEGALEFLYRLGVSELEYDEVFFPSYSIYTSVKNKETGYFDEATLYDLTSRENVAKEFLSLIVHGSVTPMTLLDIAEDYISEV